MKKKIFPITIGIAVLVILIGLALKCIETHSNLEDKNLTKHPINNENIDIVTSLEDKIGDNTAWCGTFNLIWNDLKNDLAKQDIIFAEQLDTVDNLNKGTFTTAQLSEESYYKIYGTPTLELKKQIEDAIKKKFNETSDILDDFDWVNRTDKDYFLYCMLKKEFEFPKVFDKLDNAEFGNYQNVKYFGIDNSTDEQVRNQVKVMYYNSEEDFAVKLQTKNNDEVIFTVGNNGDNFLDIYNSILENREKYQGSYGFRENDILKVPYITFDLKEEFVELEDKVFSFSNGEPYSIETALQTIKFDLDEKGGRIKSEAGMMVKNESAMMPSEPRNFIIDDAFTIFLIEKEKSLPYFAAKITDISAVQVGVNTKSNDENINNEKQEDIEIKYSKDDISLSIFLPETWEYEFFSTSGDYAEDGIKFYPKDSENYATLTFNKLFGVCGTGLHMTDIPLNEVMSASVAYYDDNKYWTFVTFDFDEDIIAQNYGLRDEEAKKAIDILTTIKYVNNGIKE